MVTLNVLILKTLAVLQPKNHNVRLIKLAFVSVMVYKRQPLKRDIVMRRAAKWIVVYSHLYSTCC